jgi:predicted acetyltransferase
MATVADIDEVKKPAAFAGLRLVRPSLARLPGYVEAMRRGWSPNTTRDVRDEELAEIAEDAAGFLRRLRGEEAGMIKLADGSEVPRLPGLARWMWDGAFCGSINLRYQPDTEELPPHVSGHVGYAVVPWKRSRGYATRALGLLLPLARRRGLSRVLLTCDADNLASRRVIAANGGIPDGDEADPHRPEIRKPRFWISTRPVRSSDGL